MPTKAKPSRALPTGGARLDPALLRIVEALARADARRDYAARMAESRKA